MSEALLADTHILKWLFDGDRRIDDRARRHLERAYADSALFASAVTLLEFGRLIRNGRFKPFDVEGWFNRSAGLGLAWLPVDADIAIEAGQLPGDPPGDPLDRLLIATSRVHGLTLATRDGDILDYGAAGHLRTLEI